MRVTARVPVTPEQAARIAAAQAQAEAANQAVEDAVIAAHFDPENPASVRELGSLPGLSAATVGRWVARHRP